MKVFTFAKVKIRLLQKSIFAKVEMVDFCKNRAGRAAQRNCFMVMVLRNAHCTLYGNQISEYFNCYPPSLEEYFGVV